MLHHHSDPGASAFAQAQVNRHALFHLVDQCRGDQFEHVVANHLHGAAIGGEGEQDADPAGLRSPSINIEVASSHHLVVSGAIIALSVGDEQRFQVSYSCLLRAMTSPFVSRCFIEGAG